MTSMEESLDERLRKQREVLDNLPEVTKKPCNECPWLRTARRGHLGPNTAVEWAEIAHGEGPVACHETIKYTGQDWKEMRQCAGMAIFRANIFKTPRHPRVVRADERNTELVFAWDDEFIAHHEGDS